MDKRYQIFISSTFEDLKEERKKIMEAILELNCFPAGMEMFPATDTEQFEYIKTIIDESDYYIIVLAGKYGTMHTDNISFIEKEFDYAVAKGVPVLAFLKKELDSLSAEKIEFDTTRKNKLKKLKEKVSTGRVVNFWDNSDDLKYKVHSSLSREFKIHPREGWIRANFYAETNNEQIKNNHITKELINYRQNIYNILPSIQSKIYIDVEYPAGKINHYATSVAEIILFLGPNLLQDCSETDFVSLINSFVEYKCFTKQAWEESCAIMPSGLAKIKTKLFAFNLIEITNHYIGNFYKYTPLGIELLKVLGTNKEDEK